MIKYLNRSETVAVMPEDRDTYKELRKIDRDTSLRYSAMTDQFDKPIKATSHLEVGTALKPPVTPASRSEKVTEKVMNALIEKFDALVLTAKGTTGAAPTQEQNNQVAKTIAQIHDFCKFCWMQDKSHPLYHNRREVCSMFLKLIDMAYIHLNESGLICLGLADNWSPPIRMLRNISQQEAVRKALSLNGKTLPSLDPGINSVRITELDDEDSEDEYESEVLT